MIVKKEFQNYEYLQVSMSYLKIVGSSCKMFFKQNRIGYICLFYDLLDFTQSQSRRETFKQKLYRFPGFSSESLRLQTRYEMKQCDAERHAILSWKFLRSLKQMYLFLNRYIPRSIFYISASLQCLGSFENKYIFDLHCILQYILYKNRQFYENINKELNIL